VTAITPGAEANRQSGYDDTHGQGCGSHFIFRSPSRGVCSQIRISEMEYAPSVPLTDIDYDGQQFRLRSVYLFEAKTEFDENVRLSRKGVVLTTSCGCNLDMKSGECARLSMTGGMSGYTKRLEWIAFALMRSARRAGVCIYLPMASLPQKPTTGAGLYCRGMELFGFL